ncbi:MAG: SRPBCC family protein [Acidimicrobiales bacterium]
MSDDAYTTSVRIDAPPSDVFPYLTEADLMIRWMGDRADLDPTPNGRFVLDINGVPIRGEYLLVEPPHRVVFTWGAAGSDTIAPGSTTVEIVLRPDGDGTVLELAHRDLPPEQLDQHGIGWGHFLSRLALAGAGRDPGPDPWARL